LGDGGAGQSRAGQAKQDMAPLHDDPRLLGVWLIRENACPRVKKSLGLTKRPHAYELTLQGESVP
jgi:hypothetical protein